MEEGFIQKGNKEAFKLLFESSYIGLCVFASKYLKNKEVSTDVVQKAFFIPVEQNLEFNSFGAARSYLYNYLRDKSLNCLCNQKLHRMLA